MPTSQDFIGLKTSYHWIGFFILLIDFCVSGIPVRLLHFVQPVAFALFYNVALLSFSAISHQSGPFYHVADFFSQETNVSEQFIRARASCCSAY